MPEPLLEIDVQAWVERAKNDPTTYRSRQATEVVLNAIAHTDLLQQKLFLKGGVLMGLAYDSPRQTTDIDLTTSLQAGEEAAQSVENLLNEAFPRIIAHLGYAGLIMQVYSLKRLPKGLFDNAQFPALKLKIGYAEAGTPQYTALVEKRSADTVEIDISFNEPMSAIQVLQMPEGNELRAYSLIDLIAEKYRAMLQQVERRRNRRQDVYDLRLLIEQQEINESISRGILAAFIEKCSSRGLEPTIESLDNDEVRQRSGSNWSSMAMEIGELPDFDESYDLVSRFYRDLPWSSEFNDG